jgi:hypothetical protein
VFFHTEDLLFAGSNAFYADNYPLNQHSAAHHPAAMPQNGNYPQHINTSVYGDSSPTISPPSGMISPNHMGGGYAHYPYSQSTDLNGALNGLGNISTYSNSPPQSHSGGDDNQAKRARNTAASARFRAKKKEREAELEKNSRRIQDNVAKLEAKVVQLETENRWLKDLVTGKIQPSDRDKDQDARNGKNGVQDLNDDWESHRHTDGVGTRRAGRKN